MEGVVSRVSHLVSKICFAALVLTMLASSAWGDTVDGEWCSADGRRLIIEGSEVTTPDGLKTIGNYDAHHYLFTAPPHEQDGETQIDIVLVTANSIHIRYLRETVGETEMQPERWLRCETKVSALPNNPK